jgi:DNA-binding response OmpR family regulator
MSGARAHAAPRTHILVVEDDHATADMLVTLLEYEQYRVSWAATAEAALAILGLADDPPMRRDPLPDLVLLDLQLPSMSGADLLRTVTRRLPTAPPVIVLSAWREADAVAAAAEIGARHVLLKPFAVDDLLARIADVAHERAAHRGGSTGGD